MERRFEPRPRERNFYRLLVDEPFWITNAEEGPPTILKEWQPRTVEASPSYYARKQAKCEP
jgi:hypothetical protein